jgi:hypothetical protein
MKTPKRPVGFLRDGCSRARRGRFSQPISVALGGFGQNLGHPALLRLSAMISQYFTRRILPFLCFT